MINSTDWYPFLSVENNCRWSRARSKVVGVGGGRIGAEGENRPVRVGRGAEDVDSKNCC